MTTPSALTSLSSYAQCLCKFIMNFIEGKVKYSGITKMELYVSFYGKFRPGWEWFIEITNYLHYLIITFPKSYIFHLCWEIVKLMIVCFRHEICSLETTIVCAKSTADPHIRPTFEGIDLKSPIFNQFWQFEVPWPPYYYVWNVYVNWA